MAQQTLVLHLRQLIIIKWHGERLSVVLILSASIDYGSGLDVIADGLQLLRLLHVADVFWGVDEFVDLVLACLHMNVLIWI